MLTAYVSKERAKKKSLGIGREENHDQMLRGAEVGVESKTSLNKK